MELMSITSKTAETIIVTPLSYSLAYQKNNFKAGRYRWSIIGDEILQHLQWAIGLDSHEFHETEKLEDIWIKLAPWTIRFVVCGCNLYRFYVSVNCVGSVDDDAGPAKLIIVLIELDHASGTDIWLLSIATVFSPSPNALNRKMDYQ